MKVIVTGGTGFVGKHVVKELIQNGHEVVVLTRNIDKAKKELTLPVTFFQWNPKEIPSAESLKGVEAVINLLGENIAAKRWSETQKKKIYDSRIVSTKNLVRGLEENGIQLQAFISASAIGYYVSNIGDTEINEKSERGSNFLASVCHDWEQAALQIKNVQRKIIIRIGVVLGSEGGALQKLIPLFKLGAGGPVGDGKQWMSWIHVNDLARILVEGLENQKMEGFYNAVSRMPVRNNEFTHALAKVLKRPAFLPAPAFALKLALGELSCIVLDSQKIMPRELEKIGFKFNFPDINQAFENICHVYSLGNEKKKLTHEKFEAYQWVPETKEEVFKFFSEAKNLEKITPTWLNFKITSQTTEDVRQGTELTYKLSLHGIPLTWKSYIDSWVANEKFVDYQVHGPYQVWHHTHKFQTYKNGTLMTDTVYYRVPFGSFGQLVAGWYVKNDVKKIFEYRKKVIEKLYKNAGSKYE